VIVSGAGIDPTAQETTMGLLGDLFGGMLGEGPEQDAGGGRLHPRRAGAEAWGPL
jgi:hypothetical protein